jgi:hypothetical protein
VHVLKRLLLQPTLHFFVVGALLFLVHAYRTAQSHTLVVTAGLRSELARRFQDEVGRAPTPAEAAKALKDWQRDEALYREALRQNLDRGDPAVRALLIEKVRAQAMREVSKRVPTDADLRGWLTGHQKSYEEPRRYAVEWFTIEGDGPDAVAERARLASKLAANLRPSHLGVPLYGASVTDAEARERFGTAVADQLPSWPLHAWKEGDNGRQLLLVQVNEVRGGLPPWEELRPRLEVDVTTAWQREEAARALDELAARYTLESP